MCVRCGSRPWSTALGVDLLDTHSIAMSETGCDGLPHVTCDVSGQTILAVNLTLAGSALRFPSESQKITNSIWAELARFEALQSIDFGLIDLIAKGEFELIVTFTIQFLFNLNPEFDGVRFCCFSIFVQFRNWN